MTRASRMAATGLVLLLAAGAEAAVVKQSFSGGVFYPTVPNHFEGMQAYAWQPGLTDKVSGWLLYNTDLINPPPKAILIGDQFAAPGFDFYLKLGNLEFNKTSISGLYQGNHATIQFDENGQYSGFFGNLDILGSNNAWYRLQQSGFTWEIKPINPSTGTTELQPVVASGYWNYKKIDKTENLNYVPPHVIIDQAPATVDAAGLAVSLDGSSSYHPSNLGFFSVLWKAGGNSVAGGLTTGADARTFGFAHPGTSVDLTLEITDTFFQKGSASRQVTYINSKPQVSGPSVEQTETGMKLSVVAGDPDLLLNAWTAGFEALEVEFLYQNQVILTGSGNELPFDQVDALFGGPGTYELLARVRDHAGESVQMSFEAELVPEPAAALLLLAGVPWPRRRAARRRYR